jgi:hypothetical protein
MHVSKASDPLCASFGAVRYPFIRSGSFRSFRNQSLACVFMKALKLRAHIGPLCSDSLLWY